MYKPSIVFCCAVLAGGVWGAFARTPDDAKDSYHIVFVSDLHLGVGTDPADPGRWHPTEDFRWHREFNDFVNAVDSAVDEPVEMVILGDFLELWQSTTDDCNNQKISKDAGCSEAQVRRRLTRILDQHRAVFDTLSAFVADVKTGNRISIVAGNHDVGLAYRALREDLISAFDVQSRSRVAIETDALWHSSDGRIIAEHGQQIGADPNKFDGWPDAPFMSVDGVSYLVQPWGEHFVQQLFNELETKFPIIDNLSGELEGVRYANQSSTWRRKLHAIGKALRFLFTQTSWSQTWAFLGEDKIPEWQVDAINESLDSDKKRWRFLVESLPVNSDLRDELASIGEQPSVDPFSLLEIEGICDRRWLTNQSDSSARIKECAGTGELGMVAERVGELLDPRAKAQRFVEYFDELRPKLPSEARAFSVYVYGHTHKAERDFRPDDGASLTVYNDGAWQRTVTPPVLCTIAKDNGWSDAEVLVKAQPEHLPACYPYVTAMLHPGESEPQIKLLYWNQPPGEAGSFGDKCTAAPSIAKSCQ